MWLLVTNTLQALYKMIYATVTQEMLYYNDNLALADSNKHTSLIHSDIKTVWYVPCCFTLSP
jgi:hypothetical protein